MVVAIDVMMVGVRSYGMFRSVALFIASMKPVNRSLCMINVDA
jgi:hypothetical protein